MSNDPFRDDRAAAHARADQLARENAQLRSDLDAARSGRRPPRSGAPVVIAVAAAGVMMLLGAGMFFAMARGGSAGSRGNGLRVSVQWRHENTGARGAIRAVAADGQTAYAVGDGGMILYRDAAGQWTAQASGVSANLRAVARGGGEVFAVGDGGTVARFDTATRRWVTEPSGTTADLYAVAFDGADVMAAGAGGTVLLRRTAAGGTSWAATETGTHATLRAIAKVPYGEQVYAVGDGGTVLVYSPGAGGGAGRWVAQSSNTQQDLRALMLDGSDLVVVGAHGTVLRTSLGTPAPWSVARVGGGGEALNAAVTASVSFEFRQANYSSSGSRTMPMVLGERGTVLVYFDPSVTGLNSPAGWFALPQPSPATLLAATTLGGSVLAVGEGGEAVLGAQP